MEALAFATLPARLPRIGGMATMPSREESRREALRHILPQVDRLFLYLDQHKAVPADIAAEPRIVPLLPRPGDRPYGAAGKLLGLTKLDGPCLYFCFDDDIVYPHGYVALLVKALHRHHFRPIVGIHGAVMNVPCAGYLLDKKTFHFIRHCPFDAVVDELGTGTIGFHSSAIRLDPRRWQHMNMVDLMVCLEAVAQGVPRIVVRHPPEFLLPIAEAQQDSVFERTRKDDSIQTRLVQAAMAHYPGLWCNAE